VFTFDQFKQELIIRVDTTQKYSDDEISKISREFCALDEIDCERNYKEVGVLK